MCAITLLKNCNITALLYCNVSQDVLKVGLRYVQAYSMIVHDVWDCSFSLCCLLSTSQKANSDFEKRITQMSLFFISTVHP